MDFRYYYEKGIMQKVAGERYVYKFVCNPEALFQMPGSGPNNEHGRMMKLEQGRDVRGSSISANNNDNGSQFCHAVINQMYSGNNNYQYYDGAGACESPSEQKCVTDYLAAYRHTHKQHYLQASVTITPGSIKVAMEKFIKTKRVIIP